jgi:assimilatory nitrate reductase catalytic subunit
VSHRGPQFTAEAAYPLILNSGRLRDQWHTMTRTGLVPRLSLHRPEPCVEIAPGDAANRGICNGDFVRLTTSWGTALAEARVTPDQPDGSLFLPMHWSDQFTGHCVAGVLANPAVDPVSHQPELKHTPVTIEKVGIGFEMLLVTRRRFKPADSFYWSRRPGVECEIYRLRGPQPAAEMADTAEALLAPQEGWELVEYRDPARGVTRLAWISGEGMEECLFLGQPGSLPEARAVIDLFAEKAPLDGIARLSLLSGAITGSATPRGRIICTCFQVGIETIREAIAADGIEDVHALGRKLRAGTNCGSCISELKEILRQAPETLVAS